MQYSTDAGNQTRGYELTPSTVDPNQGTFIWQFAVGNDSGFRAVVMPFLLPDLGAAGRFETANLTVSPYRKNGSLNFNVDLYGLNTVTDTIAPTTTMYYSGPNVPNNPAYPQNTSNSLIQASFMNPALPAFNNAILNTSDAGDAALVTWLNEVYDGGANAGKYVYLRMNPDEITGLVGTYRFLTSNNPAGSAPALGITYSALIPEPASLGLVGIGSLLVFSRRRHHC